MSKRQTAESQCDKCYARILWARNSKTGHAMPLDLKPSPDGQYLLDDFTMYCTRLEPEMLQQARDRKRSLFSNHLVTCQERNPQQSLLKETEDGNEENQH